jgi:hypothetical protein
VSLRECERGFVLVVQADDDVVDQNMAAGRLASGAVSRSSQMMPVSGKPSNWRCRKWMWCSADDRIGAGAPVRPHDRNIQHLL